MKKISIIAGILILAIVIGIFVIRVKEEDTDITKQQTKVGVILNGICEDGSWGQSHYEGMEKTKENLNLEVIYKESVPETEECIETIEDLVSQGCKIIIVDSFGYGEYELEVAKKHPDVYFYHATGVVESDNLATYFGRIYQMRYLSGIVAGLQTETNEIGYVAAFPISEVNRGLNAFTLGVKAVNPNATVYVEWTNSWNDDKLTEEATRKLLSSRNIDVISMHTDSLKALEIAEESGVWSIGYNLDNSERYPNTFLTAPTWNWDKFYETQILACLQGKFISKHYWLGIESDIVSMAPLTDNVKAGIEEIVQKEKDRLESGTFDVFYGPIKDSEGNIRINTGESMTDYSMLNEFDWYVEGVVFNGEEN